MGFTIKKWGWLALLPMALGAPLSHGARGSAAMSLDAPAVVEAPPYLEQWRGWISQGKPYKGCAEQSEILCLWTGALALDEDASGHWTAKFEIANLSEAPAKARLPGDEGKWPTLARVNGAPAPIGRDAEGPYVMLGRGQRAVVEARLDMSRATSSNLGLPRMFSIASVKPSGGALRWIDPAQGVDLAKKAEKSDSREAGKQKDAKPSEVRVRISRMIEDGQVPMMTTRVKIENSGGREHVKIDALIPEGSLPVKLQAPGATLEGSSLSLEAPAGVSVLTLVSRLDPKLDIKWSKPSSQGAKVDSREFVFIKSDAVARNINAQGRSVDPKAIDAALSFGALPTYEINGGAGLALAPKNVERLGEETKASSNSEAWLDFSGHEVFMTQKLMFSKAGQGWFEPVGGWALTQATSSGLPSVVAKSDKGESGRVAMFSGMREMAVGLRNQGGYVVELPAIASEGVIASKAQAELRVPLGWRVLAVLGAGSSAAGWWASMTLWDWFLIILTVWAAKSLLGWKGAGTALGAMVLGRLFVGAPFAVFLPMMAFLALYKNLPTGRMKTASLAMLLLFCGSFFLDIAPFTLSRLQKTMHASLEDQRQPGTESSAKNLVTEWNGIPFIGTGADTMWGSREPSWGSDQLTTAGGVSIGAVASAPMPDRMPSPAAMALGAAPIDERHEGSVAQGKPMELKKIDASMFSASMVSGAKAKREEPAPPTISVAGAQAGQGVPDWKAGVSARIVFPGPSSSASVAKVVLIPPWIVKLSSLLVLASLWACLGLIVGQSMTIWRQEKKAGAKERAQGADHV